MIAISTEAADEDVPEEDGEREDASDVIRLLQAIDEEDPRATEELLPRIYDELRRLAAQKLSAEAPGQTITASDLVHEAYLRLIDGEASGWASRRHFFGAAAEAMRRILIERARRMQRQKHGGGRRRVVLEGFDPASEPPPDGLLALEEARARLVQIHCRPAELVKLRYFAGLTLSQAAVALGVSSPPRVWSTPMPTRPRADAGEASRHADRARQPTLPSASTDRAEPVRLRSNRPGESHSGYSLESTPT